MQTINEILIRLYKMLKISKDKEFSKIYDIKPSTISSWKKRSSIPYELITEIAQKENFSLDYIFKGIEDIKNEEIKEKTNKSIDEIINRTLDVEYITERFNITVDDLSDWKINKLELIRIIELGLFKEKELNTDEDLEKERMNNIIIELLPVIKKLQEDVKVLKATKL